MKGPKILTIEDLDKWDRQSIRETAIKLFTGGSRDSAAECAIEATLKYIYAKGFDIVKSETREDTTTRPNASWYAPKETKKNYYE